MRPPQPPTNSWGPSHQQQQPRRRARRAPLWMWILCGVVYVTSDSSGSSAFGLMILATIGVVIWRVATAVHGPRRRPAGAAVAPADPLGFVLAESARRGGGVYLGVDAWGGWRCGRRERAVLVLGPPRSGKTTSVMIPAVLSHDGAVVSTSTKPDVLAATLGSRGRLARVWQFDPTGVGTAPGVDLLRWSPVTCAEDWDGALLMARAMVTTAGVGAGTTDQSHWTRRAQALLASMLHAAATGGIGIDRVLAWISTHEVDEPGALLASGGSPLAVGLLVGLGNTEARERSSIFSAAADAIDAYASHAALEAANDPNFDPEGFVRSRDAIYIHAPAERQHLAAPLVCGLLSEIRRATYDAHRAGELTGRVLLALDEVANIAPLSELPAIASEGGGQGLQLLAAIQDLSQARARWGMVAEGFLTLFGTKLILPGIADPRTLETVSVALGEYDRQVVAHTRTRAHGSLAPQRGRTVSTQRQRVLSPGEVANIPAGRGLHLDGVAWELLTLTAAHAIEPWRTLTAGTSGIRR